MTRRWPALLFPTIKGNDDMITFDQPFARLLLEICRYTYAEAFNSAASANSKQNALAEIN
jgi:hypothetical protein